MCMLNNFRNLNGAEIMQDAINGSLTKTLSIFMF